MSDEEVDELLKIADTSSGEVNYTGISYFPFFFSPSLSRKRKRKEVKGKGNTDSHTELVRTILAN